MSNETCSSSESDSSLTLMDPSVEASMVLLDVLQLPQVPSKHCRPIIHWENHLARLTADQLRDISLSRCIDGLLQV